MAKKKKSPIDIMTPPVVNNETPQEETTEVKENTDNVVIEEMVSKKEYDELYNKYLLTAADFDNYIKRSKNELNEITKRGGQKLLETLIPALNTVYSAVKNSNDDGPHLIFKTLIDALKKADVELIIPKIGDTFNGDTMNAIAAAPAPDETAHNTIIDVVSPGYKMGNKIINYPSVVVYTND